MSGIHTSIVNDAHAYTRSRSPWLLDDDRADGGPSGGVSAGGVKFGRRLFHYLAGGGLRAFGRSVRQEEADAKRSRFLVVAGLLAAVWLALLVF